MTKAPASDVIELHLNDELIIERLPFHGVLCAPTAQATGSFSCKPGRLDEFFQFLGQESAIVGMDGRSTPDVVELALTVLESKKQRAHEFLFLQIPEPTDNAIGAALLFYFLHADTFAGLIRKVLPPRDNSIKPTPK